MRNTGPGVVVVLLLSACQNTPPARPPPAREEPSSGAETPPDTPVSSPPSVPSPDSGPGGPKWVTRQGEPQAPDDWRTCTSSEQCTLVQTTCCDVCNGGSVVAVATEHEGEAKNQYERGDCSRTMCTERGCMTRAACEDGRCVLQWGNFR